MNNLYELTRKLISRGCPEHPRLMLSMSGTWAYVGAISIGGIHEEDARAIWTLHALSWAHDSGTFALSARQCMNVGLPDPRVILESLEEATRPVPPS